jgi:hypothetical protein
MLNAFLQTNSYQSNLNNYVPETTTGTKPELISQDQKLGRTVHTTKPANMDRVSLSVESVNKAIENKITEFLSKYPNGGLDQEFNSAF